MSKEYLLHDFIKDVLEHRFPGDKYRQRMYGDASDDKINFACPYCGDSTKDSSKKRGNIFFKSNTYKCFNDGCVRYEPIKDFIKNFASKYSLRIPRVHEDGENNKVKINTSKGFLIEFLMNPKIKDILIDFSDISKQYFLKPCKDAPADSEVGKYIDSRHLRNLPAFEKSCYYDSDDNKIYIFNIDLRSGKVLGLSIRSIVKDFYGPKYNIRNYTQFKKAGMLGDVDDKDITNIDMINNFFNILNIDFNKPVIILEGQIDAMFLENSIATTGVTKSKTILGTLISKNNARILFDNDKAGKTETMKLIELGYKVFLWSKLIHEIRNKYPDDRKLINEINDINDLYDFYIKIGNPLTYDEFNSHILEYFSDSVYDLISI